MALILDGAGPDAADGGPGTGGEEGEDVAEVGSSRWRIAAGSEGDGNAGELVAAEGAVDGPAIAVGDLEGGAVVVSRDKAPMPSTLGPNGKPAGVVEEGGRDEAGGFGVGFGREGRISTPGIFSKWMLTPREQGDIGERAALHWLMGQGAHVAIPFGHSPDYDLIADFGGELLRVQVKSCVCRYKQRWAVTVCTRGGNQSWQGLVKKLDPSRIDYLFVLVADGRQWFIPAARVEGATAIHLGGPKYSEFEVQRGDPIPHTAGDADASTIVSLDPRGDVRVAKGGGL